MSGEWWICRNLGQFDGFCAHIKQSWDWDKPLSIKWSSGVTKSLGQNALAHVWFRVIAQHMNKLPGNDYDEETIKTYCKRKWGVRITTKDPESGDPMQALKSLSRYEKGEMTALMNDVSEFAARIGCTLPIWGEYEEAMRSA